MKYKHSMKQILCLLFIASITTPVHGQEDDFDNPVMAAPPVAETPGADAPIPPPAAGNPSPIRSGSPTRPILGRGGSTGGRFGSAPGSASTTKGKSPNGSILTPGKQDKFNNSGPEEITNENFPETIESFDFPNADITDLIKAMSELTGRNFILDNNVRGKITIIAPSKITVAEAYRAFLSALAVNGFTVVPSGSFLKVKNSRQAQRDSIEIYSGSYYPNTDQMITRIVHLKHISAAQVQREIMSLFSSRDGEYRIYEATNSIIMSDYGSNIDRVMKILNQLDVPGFEEQLEVIPIKYAKAKDMADMIDKIVNKGQGSSNRFGTNTFQSGVPRFSNSSRGGATSGSSGSASYMAIPDDRTNSIIVVGNKPGIARVKKLVSQLDFRIKPEDSGGVNVYYVKYGDAVSIAQVLQGVAKDAAKPAATPFAAPGFGTPMGAANNSGNEIFGGDVKISADKNTNSLVILASKQDYDTVLQLLGKLDVPRDQVYVETIVMEMSMSDTDSWGTGYYQYSSSGFGKGGFGFVDQGTISNVLSPLPAGNSAAILPFTSGSVPFHDLSNPSTSSTPINVPSLAAFITLLKKNRKTNILSTPQILAMDNQESEIEVGDSVATSLTQSQNTNGTTTYTPTFEKATIKITLKPFISPSSETIKMDYKQTIKQLNNTITLPKALQDNSQPLSERNLKTMIVINNGDTAVLGGLLRDQDTESVNKVPFLGDIPILGWLFKGRDTTKEKVNMLVFLTPKIIRNPADQKKVLGQKLDERLNFIKEGDGKDPFGRRMNDLQRNNSLQIDQTATAQPAPTNAPAPVINQ